MTNPLLEIERRLLGDLYAGRHAQETLEILCDEFGSRWSGSPDGERAAQFMEERLGEYGLANCHREPFQFMGWKRGPATLRILSPVERELACISLPMCPPATVEAQVVEVGDGGPADFAAVGERLRGAVAMVGATPPRGLNRTVHRSEKYGRSLLSGAAAFLYVGQYPGFGPETGSIANDREALIPGVSIRYEDGELLRRLLRRHNELTLRIETTDRSAPATGWNVVGELPGHTHPEEWVLVGCHYDGHDIAQGAHDPASGAVALLEAARVLAAHAAGEVGCGVRFVLFDAEEIGLLGGYRYAEAHEAELDGVRFRLNLDAAGSPGRKGLNVNRWPQLEPIFARWEREMGDDLPIAQKTSAFSDHYPFFLAGVPTAMMGDPGGVNTGRGFDHSAFDTVDKVDPADMREAAAMAARLALRISREDPWPARRRGREEVEALIAAEPSLEGKAIEAGVDALYRSRS